MRGSVLFAHDGPVFKTTDGSFYGVHVNDKLLQRYHLLGRNVTLLMRVLIIDSASTTNYSKISDPDFKVIEVPDFKSIRGFFRNYSKAQGIVDEAVRDHEILLARLPSATGAMAAKAALKYKKPVLAEFVACTYDAYWNYNWKGKLIAHYKMWVQKNLVKKLPYIIYVTKQFLQRRYPSPAKQINCSNVELASVDEGTLTRRRLRINNYSSEQVLVLGTVAAIDVPFKGQSDVIKAIGKLKRMGHRFEYRIVGQGKAEYLQRFIDEADVADRVRIVGPLKHSEVFNFLDEIDLYIQPSKQEGLPRALVEAMSRACPALGARTAGIPELIHPDCIFKPCAVDEIVQKLLEMNPQRLLANAELNFEEAKNYRRELLEQRRRDFYNLFLSETALK